MKKPSLSIKERKKESVVPNGNTTFLSSCIAMETRRILYGRPASGRLYFTWKTTTTTGHQQKGQRGDPTISLAFESIVTDTHTK